MKYCPLLKHSLTTIVAGEQVKFAAIKLFGLGLAWYDARMKFKFRRRAREHRTATWGVWGALVFALLLATGCDRSEVYASEATPAPTNMMMPALMTVPPARAVSTMATATATNHATLTDEHVSAAIPTSTPRPAGISLLTILPTPTPTITPQSTPQYAPTPDSQARTLRIPVLMYHYVSTPPADADIYRVDLSVPPALLAEHLDRLQAEGYTTISPYDLTEALQRGRELPAKPILITFDDGYRDNYDNAYPLLRERGMQATIFVVTDFIDEQRPAYLTWDMARELAANGIAIESHGRNHMGLADKEDDYLVWQALGSLETIEYELGTRPRFVSYPAGEYDQRTIDVFRSAGYWAGFTTDQGTEQHSDAPFQLERIRVRNTTSADELIRLLTLDW